jgi:glycosyltransferase involved in cell wall biosynthesis
MKTLVLIPSYAKVSLDKDVAEDRHPTMDYRALIDALSQEPDDSTELIDYASVDREWNPAVRLARKLAGRNVALAVMGFLRCASFDAIFTNAESVALPLSMLLAAVPRRPRHVTIAHRLSAKKKQPLYRRLKLFRQMDVIFVYSSAQRDFACSELGIPPEQVRLIPFHADERFYRPLADVHPEGDQICAAGLERRDYPTLLRAMADQTDLPVKLAAASPWSKQANEVADRNLPPHISTGCYEYNELRTLYAKSSIVGVPLYENDFQAGVTTTLEAMAMGKPVIVTSTTGQTDVIIHGKNGLCVPPGDVEAWKDAIARLRHDDALRARLGQEARRWVEENATLDRWVTNIISGLRSTTVSETDVELATSALGASLAAT